MLIDIYFIGHPEADNLVSVIWEVFDEFWNVTDIITYCIAIYVFYEFGHKDYMKLCGLCHNAIYNRYKKRHQYAINNEEYSRHLG